MRLAIRAIMVLSFSLSLRLGAQNIDFRYPLDTTPILSGTFGEFRGTHFHAGIDLKTFGKTGLPIYACESGYISRIKISPYGYGKAIYINHENGYTSVYGHLSGFNPEIEEYIREHQYKKKSYSIELFPTKGKLRYEKGQFIGYSGNTGGSAAPHVHFELRDTKTQEILDPLGLNVPVLDTLPPVLELLQIHEKHRQHKIWNGEYPVIQQVNVTDSQEITVHLHRGIFGLSFSARDLMLEGTENILGVNAVQVTLDDQLIYNRKTERFSFRDSKYIYSLSRTLPGFAPLELTYKETWVEHNMAQYLHDGWFTKPNNQDTSKVIIQLSDAKRNTQSYTLTLIWNDSLSEKAYPTPYYPPHYQRKEIFNHAESFDLENNQYLVDFFEHSFEDTTGVIVGLKHGAVDTLEILPSNLLITDRYRIVYSIPSNFPGITRQICLGRKSESGTEYISTEAIDGQCRALVKSPGQYFITLDSISPIIEFQHINSDSIVVYVSDDFSGIATYQPKINGKWFLMEFDPKTGVLFGDIRHIESGGKLDFELVVKDNRGNSNTLKIKKIKP